MALGNRPGVTKKAATMIMCIPFRRLSAASAGMPPLLMFLLQTSAYGQEHEAQKEAE
jgi:hypothetical protein